MSWLLPLVQILVLLNAVLIAVTYMVLLERKVIAWAQSRLGPMRVGPHGVLQPIADAIKLLLKEDITPARADKWLFTIAPIMSLVPALIAFAVIPFGGHARIFGRDVPLFIAENHSDPFALDQLEIPAQMRARSLILENVDGTQPEGPTNRFVLRAVPHTTRVRGKTDASPGGSRGRAGSVVRAAPARFAAASPHLGT